jgi:hypothetical protein
MTSGEAVGFGARAFARVYLAVKRVFNRSAEPRRLTYEDRQVFRLATVKMIGSPFYFLGRTDSCFGGDRKKQPKAKPLSVVSVPAHFEMDTRI